MSLNKNNIIFQMSDVRPAKRTKNLQWKKSRVINKQGRKKENNIRKNVLQKAKINSFLQEKKTQEKTFQSKSKGNLDAIFKKALAEEKSKKTQLKKAPKQKKKPKQSFLHQSQFSFRTEKQNKFLNKKLLSNSLKLESKTISNSRINKSNFTTKSSYSSGSHNLDFSLTKTNTNLSPQSQTKNNSKFKEKIDTFFSWLSEKHFSFIRLLNYQGRNRKLFSVSLVLVLVFIAGMNYYYKARKIKGRVLGISDQAYQQIVFALDDMKQQKFSDSQKKLEEAESSFKTASQELAKLGTPLIYLSHYIPYLSRLYSGYNLLQAGEEMSLAGQEAADLLKEFNQLKNVKNSQNISWINYLQKTNEQLKKIDQHIEKTDRFLEQVKLSDLPSDKQVKIIKLKKQLKNWQIVTQNFLNNDYILIDLLGGNGPRKYLFLFQNNQEIRATGGFIGSYGVLSLKSGRVDNFFVDGIFNPDGQLKENIIPPRPIQKISAGWSMHDSNWWPDFPKSAEKAILFYEKTGGPTVDGVIAITPEVLKKMLAITGPVYLPEYDVLITENNFLEILQSEVEVNYNKTENRPKKILASLTGVMLKQILQLSSTTKVLNIFQSLENSLNEKDILIYSRNNDLEKIISQQGWAGEIKETSKDYLNVINTNINGYKTDKVVKESIQHKVTVNENGSITDDVFITREHQGGDTPYEWWNKVNADYMRVYVPLGSQLLLAEGQTKEQVQSPLNYQKEGFKKDPDIVKEEKNMIIDPTSGTRIYEDSGKTVFANWVYVSPGEKVTIHYRYRLPFFVNFTQDNNYYSLLIQKQAGSWNDKFRTEIRYPDNWKLRWKSSEWKENQAMLQWQTVLLKDNFLSCLWEKE